MVYLGSPFLNSLSGTGRIMLIKPSAYMPKISLTFIGTHDMELNDDTMMIYHTKSDI